MGETLKVVWAESQLYVRLFYKCVHFMAYANTAESRLVNSAQVLSCQLKFVHEQVHMCYVCTILPLFWLEIFDPNIVSNICLLQILKRRLQIEQKFLEFKQNL